MKKNLPDRSDQRKHEMAYRIAGIIGGIILLAFIVLGLLLLLN